MKKSLTIFLAAAMALALTACSGGKDAKAVYDNATKKTSELTSVEANSAISMQMTQGENKTDIKMDLDMKMSGINTDSMKYLAEGTTSLMGQDIDLFIYYEGGYYYMDSMGQKIKYAMDLDEMMEQIKQGTEGASVDSSYLKDIKASEDGDNQTLTFTIDAEKMDAYVKELMVQLGTSGMEGVTYNIKEAKGEATINKEGYFSSQKITLSMDMTTQGETFSIVMDTDTTYKNPGQTVEVTTPDLNGYTEVDPSTMQAQ